VADCCLGQVYAYAGRLHDAFEAGHRLCPFFEARVKRLVGMPHLWGLSLTAIPLRSLVAQSDVLPARARVRREKVNDRRLKAVASGGRADAHSQGTWRSGCDCCDEALALSPVPYDAVMARDAHGYGLIKLGQDKAGTRRWGGRRMVSRSAGLRFTAAWFALWLADGYLLQGSVVRFVRSPKRCSNHREAGYRYFEGIARTDFWGVAYR